MPTNTESIFASNGALRAAGGFPGDSLRVAAIVRLQASAALLRALERRTDLVCALLTSELGREPKAVR